MKKLTLFTDGGSRNNPGPAGIGGVAYDHNHNEVFRFKKFIGIKTNNQAEYAALIEGLTLAEKYNARDVDSVLDSELVVRQLNGQYKVKHPDIKPLVERVFQLKNGFGKVTFRHVLRNKNAIADKLV